MKNNVIQKILDVMNDGSRIDRYLHKFEEKYYLTDDSNGGVKIPVFYDSEPTAEDAEHYIKMVSE